MGSGPSNCATAAGSERGASNRRLGKRRSSGVLHTHEVGRVVPNPPIGRAIRRLGKRRSLGVLHTHEVGRVVPNPPIGRAIRRFPKRRSLGQRIEPMFETVSTIFATTRVAKMAEGVGFEPTGPFGPAVFKTAAINHSTTPPGSRFALRGRFRTLGPYYGSGDGSNRTRTSRCDPGIKPGNPVGRSGRKHD